MLALTDTTYNTYKKHFAGKNLVYLIYEKCGFSYFHIPPDMQTKVTKEV